MASILSSFSFSVAVLLSVVIVCAQSNEFPKDFLFGVGSSSYQIEGGWNADGKGESIWDHLTHSKPASIEDESNADKTADSYNNWKRDVDMVQELGVDIYRFSISWTRILPGGFSNHVNKAGINYYSNLIDELMMRNITPMVTMYHWELPQRLQELGGWTNPEIIDIFVDYATVLLEQFGDRIKFWTTLNEPWHVCEQAYGQDYMAPSYDFPGIPSYLCGHNLIKAHAKVYHLYKNKFNHQKGVMGITADTSYPQARTHTEGDQKASERALQFYLGWFMNPIFGKNGNYPKVMIDRIGELSKRQGFSKSRLPVFTPEEIKMIQKSSDFFGINSYTSVLVTSNDDEINQAKHSVPSFPHDMGTIETQDESWPKSGSVWLRVHPSGMRHLLNWIRKEYDNPPVYVTENGVSDKGGLVDSKRVDYLNSYLSAISHAIKDGCNVKGYVAWSLMDSFEWKAGFTEKFGLYHVDFNHPNRTRTAKLSAKVYANIVKTHKIDLDFNPKLDVLKVSPRQSGNSSSSLNDSLILNVLVIIVLSLRFL